MTQEKMMTTLNRLFRSCIALAAFAQTAPAMAHDSKPVRPVAASLSPMATAAAMVVDAFHAALQRGDTKAAAAQMASDALIYESGGVERSKAEYASHHLAADAAFAKTTTLGVKKRSGNATGDFAWIATEGVTTGSYKGRAINSLSTETMVLRREKGLWRIVHIHWSSANVK